jgi:hypothetical protein
MYSIPVCPGRPGNVSPAAIRAAAGYAAFGQPLIVNVLRGLVAETIVAEALSLEWTWCSTDYSAWDFIRSDGKRLEVKQSAARQSWAANGAKPQRLQLRHRASSRPLRWVIDVDPGLPPLG